MADFSDFIIPLIVWLISTIFFRSLFKSRTKSCLPPSPRALPIIGHLHLLGPIHHQALHNISIRYGPLVHIYLGSVPYVVVSSPEVAIEFLKTNEISFSNRFQTNAVDYLTYGSKDFTFASYGPYWKFIKKLCMSQLLGVRTLSLLLPVRRDEIKLFMASLLEKAKAGKAVDVGEELMKVTNNVISRMVMSERCSENEEEAGEVRKLVREITELMEIFNFSDFIWFCKKLDLQGLRKRLRNARDRFDKMMERIIEEHIEARKEIRDVDKDLLHILLDTLEDESSEIRLTMENIKAFILDTFLAGTDTSAITMGWALAELINHADIMEKAVQEMDSVVGKKRLVEESDMANLPYLQAIVKETLRLHPAIPVLGRESTEECTISGYKIAAKTRLFVNAWTIGRDSKYWEKPLEFCPERFLMSEDEGKGKVHFQGQHFQFLAFGSGRRGCPGATLALQLVQTTLAAMIQCFEWKAVNGKVDMEEGPGLTLLRAHPLVCVPVPRLIPFPSM